MGFLLFKILLHNANISLFFLLGGEKAVWGRSWFGNEMLVEMLVRLDIFHWIHRFDAAIRTEPHAKYSAFKSALK